MGLSPPHRWPFNTSLATANEAGAAAAPLNPADSAQMFTPRSPAVPAWEGVPQSPSPWFIGGVGVGVWRLSFTCSILLPPALPCKHCFSREPQRNSLSISFGRCALLCPSVVRRRPVLLRNCCAIEISQLLARAPPELPSGPLACALGSAGDKADTARLTG